MIITPFLVPFTGKWRVDKFFVHILLKYKYSEYKLPGDKFPENKQHKDKLRAGKRPWCNLPEDKNSDDPPAPHYPSPFQLTPSPRLTI